MRRDNVPSVVLQRLEVFQGLLSGRLLNQARQGVRRRKRGTFAVEYPKIRRSKDPKIQRSKGGTPLVFCKLIKPRGDTQSAKSKSDYCYRRGGAPDPDEPK